MRLITCALVLAFLCAGGGCTENPSTPQELDTPVLADGISYGSWPDPDYDPGADPDGVRIEVYVNDTWMAWPDPDIDYLDDDTEVIIHTSDGRIKVTWGEIKRLYQGG